MRIAFVALNAPGHLNPTTALARQLQSRNHEVVVISLPDAEPYVCALPVWNFFLVVKGHFLLLILARKSDAGLSVVQGLDGVRLIVESVAFMMEAVLGSLPAALEQTQAKSRRRLLRPTGPLSLPI
jgi:zeaxanthin glucosyltransferase